MAKIYADVATYEAKLGKVMKRLGVSEFDYNFDRFSCFVELTYNGRLYRFEHSVQNAQNHGSPVKYGSDAFAQVVLELEDITRMTEHGIYDLAAWISGFAALPKSEETPECYRVLGFNETPYCRGAEGAVQADCKECASRRGRLQ